MRKNLWSDVIFDGKIAGRNVMLRRDWWRNATRHTTYDMFFGYPVYISQWSR